MPDKYDLKLPAGSTLDAAALERTAATARELGLPDDATAQKVLELVHQEVAAQRDAFLQSHSPGDPAKNIPPGEAWVQQQESWKTAAMADKEIGGTPEQFEANVAAANRAFDKFSTPEFRAHVWQTGLASHPEVVRVFARIGKAMSEGSVVMPGAQGAAGASAAEVLFGGTKKG